MIAIEGYRITERFFQDTEKFLYRGIREKDGTPVIVKTTASEYPNPEGQGLIRREYEVSKDLNIKGLLKPYALEDWDNSLALVLEHFGGLPLQTCLESDMPKTFSQPLQPVSTSYGREHSRRRDSF